MGFRGFHSPYIPSKDLYFQGQRPYYVRLLGYVDAKGRRLVGRVLLRVLFAGWELCEPWGGSRFAGLLFGDYLDPKERVPYYSFFI